MTLHQFLQANDLVAKNAKTLLSSLHNLCVYIERC